MTVTETVTKSGITPNPEYKGIETADDFILAIQSRCPCIQGSA